MRSSWLDNFFDLDVLDAQELEKDDLERLELETELEVAEEDAEDVDFEKNNLELGFEKRNDDLAGSEQNHAGPEAEHLDSEKESQYSVES